MIPSSRRPASQAKSNPLGHDFGSPYTIVRIGNGQQTHLWNPETQHAICGSGTNAGRYTLEGERAASKPQTFYRSDAQYVTCWRCMKLGEMNLKMGKPADGSRG